MDGNAATKALTGNENILVKYHSTALCTITAQAKNGATLNAKKINGAEVTGSSLEIPNMEIGTFSFEVQDSRGYSAAVSVNKILIPYVKLTVNASVKRTDPTSGNAVLEISGDYFTSSFGTATNILNLRYRVNSGDEVAISPTIADGKYTATVEITGLDYDRSHTIAVLADDKLESVSRSLTVKKGIPTFDWGENDFAFHVPVAAEKISGLALPAGNSDAASKQYVDSLVLDKIYPINSIYISYSHTSPASLFGGTWTRIGSRFLLAAEAGDAIGEVGGEEEVALTQAQLPNHSHGSVYTGDPDSKSFTFKWLAPGAGKNLGYDTVTTGGGAAHNNMPPYVKVSIWRRKA